MCVNKKRGIIVALVLVLFLLPSALAQESKDVEFKILTVHEDTCNFELYPQETASLITQDEMNTEDGLLHSYTLELEEGDYRLEFSCDKGVQKTHIFSVILTDPVVWVVEPSGIEEFPQYAMGSEEVFDLVLESSREVTCKYTNQQTLTGPTSSQERLMESFNAWQDFEDRENSRFGLSVDMQEFQLNYQFTGQQLPLKMVCEEEILGEKSYFFQQISIGSTTQEFNIEKIDLTPQTIIDPLARNSQIRIQTNQNSICWIDDLPESVMDYNIKSKEVYDDISNYSTVTTDTITISEGLYEENYLFNVTCESLAGITSTNQKNLYVEITSNPNPEVLRPSNYESANDIPVQIQTQIITDFCSYSLEKNPTLADFTRLETEDNLIHTGSISDLQQGENTLKYICQGDGSTYRHDFTIDRTRPSLVNITSEDITCGFEDVQVLFDAQDNISGIQRYLYEVQIPDEDTEEFNTTNSRNYVDLSSRMQDKTITIRSRAQNGAGLLSQGFSSKEILVTNSSIPQCDTQPPLAIVSDMFNEEQNAWEVSVECQDDIGCKNQFNYGLTYGQECVYDNSAQTGTILEFSESIRFCYAVYDQNNNNDTGFIDLQIDYSPHCFNEIQDADETGVDCGGSCDSCEVGNSCEIDEDCDTNFCSENICVVATCTDEVQNQDETGVDCGGSCPGCQLQSQCQADSDCLSNNCQNNICQEPSCENNITDGSETDVDCGGSDCQSCELAKSCLQDSDCQSNYCEDNICKTPTTSQPGLDDEQEQDQDLQLPSQNEEDISLLKLIITAVGFFFMIAGIGLIYYDHSFTIKKSQEIPDFDINNKNKKDVEVEKVEKLDPEEEKKKQEKAKQVRKEKLAQRKQLLKESFKEEKKKEKPSKPQKEKAEEKDKKTQNEDDKDKKDSSKDKKEEQEDVILGQEEDVFEKLKNTK